MAENLAQDSAIQGVTYEGGDFASLLQKEFKPKSNEAKSAVETAVQTLAQQALGQTKLIGKDVTQSINAMIAAIDEKLTAQVNQILHNADFQKLEGAWRGLHFQNQGIRFSSDSGVECLALGEGGETKVEE